MCTGLEFAAIASAVGGTGASIAGQRQANKTAAAATQGQTQLSSQQFDTRNALAKDIFAENMGLSQQMWEALNKLDDDEFAARTGLSKQAFNQLNEIERAQIVRDAAAADESLATRNDARAVYNADIAAANEKQSGYRAQGDAVAQDLMAAFSPEAQAQRRSAGTANRVALYDRAAPPPAAPASPRLTDQTRMVFEREAGQGRNFAAGQNRSASHLAAFDDMLSGGDRAIDKGNRETSFLTDAATRALAPLGAKLDVSSARFNNSGADLDAAVNISAQTARGASRPVQAYSTAMDDAMAAFYGNSRSATGGAGQAKIDANNAVLGGVNAASGNFENTMAGITDYRIRAGQNNFWTGAGQFANALAPIFLQVGQRGSVATPAAPAKAA